MFTYHLLDGELFTGCGELPIDGDAGGAVEVEPVAVAAPQVAEQVAASALEGGRPHQVKHHVGLAQLKVGAAAVADDFRAVQSLADVRAIRGGGGLDMGSQQDRGTAGLTSRYTRAGNRLA